jgi:TolA-binding protein
MPKAGAYRANSVIYFQGDNSDRIFILQSGRVTLKYSDIETGKDTHEAVQVGEFFGVKSALGKYPREENALVQSDATVLVFSVPEFEVFSQANTRIIMKMLKVFSNQLRRVHKQVENLLEKGESLSPETGLFSTGAYYLKNRLYSQAKYVFSRYLTYFPAGAFAAEASRYLETAESAAQKFGDGKGPAPMVVDSARRAAGKAAAAGGPGAGDTEEPKEDKNPGEDLSTTAKEYYDAVSLFSQEKYKEAMSAFKRIVEANRDPEYVAKAIFDLGRSLYMLKDYDGAVKHFTGIVQTNPKHPDLVDILFYLGQAWEKKGDTERAKGFYKKILTMEADEDAAPRLKAKKALKHLEEAANG